VSVSLADGEPRRLDGVALDIDPAEVLRFQGYKIGGEPPPSDVLALFDDALTLGRRLMSPRVAVRWLPAVPRGPHALEVGGEMLAIPGIAARWGPVERAAIAVCTIGDALERRVRALWDRRELPLAAMLDSVGSGAAESLAEYANDVLCQEGLGRDLRVTNRISPGYGAWDVGAQTALFRLCPGESIGVSLNDACFMTPEKSITFLAGAGVAARVDDYFSQCARCWMASCAYRRVPAGRIVRHGGLRAPPKAPRARHGPGDPGRSSVTRDGET
jgi:hypothetical protein